MSDIRMSEVIDIAAVATAWAALAEVVSKLPALFSLIWLLIRIYETKTVQDFIAIRKKRRMTARNKRVKPDE